MVYCRFEDWGCEVEGRGEETSTGFDELVGLSSLKILHVGIPDEILLRSLKKLDGSM